MPFEILPHPSDAGIRARGPDFAAALREAVRGLAALISGGATLGDAERKPATVDSADPEEQVVRLLDEVLYHVDAHGWLAADAEVAVRPDGLDVVLLGAPFDPDAFDGGVHVKAVTWHGLSVGESATPSVVPGVPPGDSPGVQIIVYIDL